MSELTRVGDPPALLRGGDVLVDRYRLRGLLGRGGMAEVYLAEDDVLRRPVAVKVFHAGTGSLDQGRRQRQEAELLASLNHPGLVTVFDAGVDADHERAFLVMEIVRGPTLEERLAAGPLPDDRVREVGACLAEALEYVHEQGVVHRDVKPGNVLFIDDEECSRVKLADFGIARMTSSGSLTDAGLILGSARYLSPEQARGAAVGPPSDVYSLGLVLLECLTGMPVFPGAGIEAAVARLHRDPEIPDRLDPALGGLLRVMTSREPTVRPTPSRVATTLTQAPSTRLLLPVETLPHDDATTRQPSTESIVAPRTWSLRHWAWVAGGCAGIVVALAGAAASVQNPDSPSKTAEVVSVPAASADATHMPPATPTTTPSAPVQPVAQPVAPAEPLTNDSGGEEAPEEGNASADQDGKSNKKAKDKGTSKHN